MELLEFYQFYCSILKQLTQSLLKGSFDPPIIILFHNNFLLG